jgi:hypothetical protein
VSLRLRSCGHECPLTLGRVSRPPRALARSASAAGGARRRLRRRGCSSSAPRRPSRSPSSGGGCRGAAWLLLRARAGVRRAGGAHDRVIRDRDRSAALVGFYERGLARIEDRWRAGGSPATATAATTTPTPTTSTCSARVALRAAVAGPHARTARTRWPAG